MPLLELEKVSFSYPGRRVLDGVSLVVREGEVAGLVGANGSGKSTLLQVALGAFETEQGEVRLDGMPVRSLSRREIARRAAFVPQDTAVPFAFPVEDVIHMGRFPHLGRFQVEGPDDQRAVAEAMRITETEHLSGRPVNELSGGERQRVFLARALAQSPKLLALDEPISNLDLVHQIETLMVVREMASGGRGAIVAMHDLSLASRFCDRILLLSGGRIVAEGQAAAVFTPENLRAHFGIEARVECMAEGLSIIPLAPVKKR